MRPVQDEPLITRNMTLRGDAFGWQALESYARARGGAIDEVVRMAALYYLAGRESGRLAWRVPRFVRERSADSPDLLVHVSLADETWKALAREASLQAVSPDRLLEHAVLYFLADLHSRRLADRLG